jgi:quercetin dioxygenase-like cupin family protein
MKLLIATLVSIPLMSLASAATQPAPGTSPSSQATVTVSHAGTQASVKGPAEWFTGTVRIDPLFAAKPPARGSAASVTFEPGARTAWHVHPLGQTLVVTAGTGRVQAWGGPVQELHPGDVVSIPARQKHWHGAAPTTAMTHIAIQEAQDGKAVEWMEKVTDAQYGVRP